MGMLLTLNEISKSGINEPWYFDDAYVNGSTGKYHFNWPSGQFPYMVAIPYDVTCRDTSIKVRVRKWVEQTSDTVIVDMVDHSYRQYFNKDRKWENSWEVKNKWYRFHFDNDPARLAFSLAFVDYITPITKWHPERPEDKEEIDYMEQLRKVG